jgi:hypothetical protein
LVLNQYRRKWMRVKECLGDLPERRSSLTGDKLGEYDEFVCLHLSANKVIDHNEKKKNQRGMPQNRGVLTY